MKCVAVASNAQAVVTYILNQTEAKRVRNVHTPVKNTTNAKFKRHFHIESSPSIPSRGKWPWE